MHDFQFQPLPNLPGWASAHVPTIGSTNSTMAALYEKKASALDRHWLTAAEQTEGRGRRNRPWASPPGNFYGSVCLGIEGVRAPNIAILPLAIGIAIQKTVAQLASGTASLKWPNDVLLDNAKCCGLLMERHTGSQGVSDVIIAGIGLNITSHPPDTPYPATHLAAHGFSGSVETVFNTLAMSLDAVLRDLRSPGFVPQVRQTWLASAKGVGDVVDVRLANNTLRGIFEQLDDEGRLVLRLADKTKRIIAAGDVFFA
ncbi:MAG: biotin--[acetyl-CoA-carboxylase] ligase [Pseudomonadota bacterium]